MPTRARVSCFAALVTLSLCPGELAAQLATGTRVTANYVQNLSSGRFMVVRNFSTTGEPTFGVYENGVRKPVHLGDPTVLKIDGMYYLTGTAAGITSQTFGEANFPIYSSPDLVNWKLHMFAFRVCREVDTNDGYDTLYLPGGPPPTLDCDSALGTCCMTGGACMVTSKASCTGGTWHPDRWCKPNVVNECTLTEPGTCGGGAPSHPPRRFTRLWDPQLLMTANGSAVSLVFSAYEWIKRIDPDGSLKEYGVRTVFQCSLATAKFKNPTQADGFGEAAGEPLRFVYALHNPGNVHIGLCGSLDRSQDPTRMADGGAVQGVVDQVNCSAVQAHLIPTTADVSRYYPCADTPRFGSLVIDPAHVASIPRGVPNDGLSGEATRIESLRVHHQLGLSDTRTVVHSGAYVYFDKDDVSGGQPRPWLLNTWRDVANTQFADNNIAAYPMTRGTDRFLDAAASPSMFIPIAFRENIYNRVWARRPTGCAWINNGRLMGPGQVTADCGQDDAPPTLCFPPVDLIVTSQRNQGIAEGPAVVRNKVGSGFYTFMTYSRNSHESGAYGIFYRVLGPQAPVATFALPGSGSCPPPCWTDGEVMEYPLVTSSHRGLHKGRNFGHGDFFRGPDAPTGATCQTPPAGEEPLYLAFHCRQVDEKPRAVFFKELRFTAEGLFEPLADRCADGPTDTDSFLVPFRCPNDIDQDNDVDAADQSMFAVLWAAGNDGRADINKDGFINAADQQEFAAKYPNGCTRPTCAPVP